jgi:DNA modification methylase/ParB-like chromosome segregation protein Spo0J
MPKPRDFTLPTEIVLIKDLKPHPRNYRKHPKEQLNHIVQSIKENKIYRNVVIAKDNTILAGHGVIEGLQILEATEAPCIRLDIEPDSPEALKVLAGDNEIANLANDNTFLLAELLKEVSDKTDNLIGTGYTDSTLEDLLDSLTKSSEGTEYQEPEYQGDNGYSGGDGDGDDTEPREVKEAIEDDFEQPEENEIKTDIVLGDLFEIGNHRLLCGDSTDKDSVGRLMNGEKADMVFTDPPYGINYKSPSGRGKTERGDYEIILNDDKEFDPSCLFGYCEKVVCWGANHYANKLQNSARWLVWDKRDGDAINRNSDCEMAWCSHGGSARLFHHKWNGMIKASERSERRVHPTQKPIALVAWAFDVCEAGENILDLFLGSGTTMVASHQLDRRCYGMELDPKYCQVIIERMIKLDPTLVIKKNGEPFTLDIK